MKKSNILISLAIGILLFLATALFLPPEAYAIMWDDFAKGMNEAFSQKNVFTARNFFFLVMILLIVVTLISIIQIDTIRTDIKRRKAYQEIQKELEIKRQYMESSNSRAWFRVPIVLQFKWHALPVSPYAKPKHYQDITLDVSGGGLLFKTTQALAIKDEIKLWLPIDKTPIELNAQVVRLQEEKQEDKTYYLVGVKFINIREGIRDKIIAWITKSQADDLVRQKENMSVELDDVNYPEDEKNIDETISIENATLLSQPTANFSGSWQDNKIKLLVNLQEKSLPLSGTIINTTQEQENSLIVTVKIDI